MANISIRKIDDETFSRLRMQAASHGVSMEEEVRQIIKRAISTPEKLGDLAMRLFSPAHGEEPLIVPERTMHEPPDFGQPSGTRA